MKDLYHNVLVTQVLHPVTATTTRTSSTIDLQGFNSLNVVFALGTSGDTLSGSVFWTLKLQDSDDDSSYGDVAASDMLSSAASVAIDSASLDETAYAFGYAGRKRYVRAVATPTGTHTNGTVIGMLALRANAAYSPVA
jgi:hypothetical protein